MIVLPLMLLVYLAVREVISYENMTYAILGATILFGFVIMLGIHCGLNYVSGRTAILNSIGTVFFLCVGIAICMTIMVSFRGAFQLQLAPFLVMILGGGAALFASLGWRNPSSAIFFWRAVRSGVSGTSSLVVAKEVTPEAALPRPIERVLSKIPASE